MIDTLASSVFSDPPCELGPLTSESSLELFVQGSSLGLGFAPGELLAALWTRLVRQPCA